MMATEQDIRNIATKIYFYRKFYNIDAEEETDWAMAEDFLETYDLPLEEYLDNLYEDEKVDI